VANRDQHSSADLKARIDFLEREFGAQIELMHMDCIDVSSTQVRDMVHENKDISDLVDEKVKAYIIEKGLYI
jgi:nicotinic acid mononucleotide adenylyltransferase